MKLLFFQTVKSKVIIRFGTVCFLNENYIFQVTCCLYYFAIAKWDTGSNKSTDFLLNPVLYIIYACLYMSLLMCWYTKEIKFIPK